MKTVNAAFWDMDGTIIDTEPYWLEAKIKLMKEYGGKWLDSYKAAFIGKSIDYVAKFLFEVAEVKLQPKQIVDYLVTEVNNAIIAHAVWMPGAKKMLAEFKSANIPNVLVTMSYDKLAQTVISKLPQDTFTAIVTGDMLANSKPHPEAYLQALQKLQEKGFLLEASKCVAFEDSAPGITSAYEAGITTIAIPYLKTEILDIPEIVYWNTLEGKSFADVNNVLVKR